MSGLNKRVTTTLKLGAGAMALVAGVGLNGFTSEAAFDAKYYNINENGGRWDGMQYVLDDGTVITNAFFCDGTYTYFLQYDGTPMKDVLTYHPDGEQIIYFDAKGHECFDTFANVKKSISGEAVDDLCYFGTTGNMYVNVITYDVSGTYIYYANPYGVMERKGGFQLDTNATNYEALAKDCLYGYANPDGTIIGFYQTPEEANAQKPTVEVPATEENEKGTWELYATITYDKEGKIKTRLMQDGNVSYKYSRNADGKEFLAAINTEIYDKEGVYCGYERTNYGIDENKVSYVSNKIKEIVYPEKEKISVSEYYDVSGKLLSAQTLTYDTSTDGIEIREITNKRGENVQKIKDIWEYDENKNLLKTTAYEVKDGEEKQTSIVEYSYIEINGEFYREKAKSYGVATNGMPVLLGMESYEYDEYGNCISLANYQITNRGSEQIEVYNFGNETEYCQIGDKWYKNKYWSYYGFQGAKLLAAGYEYDYDEKGNVTKEIRYEGDGDKPVLKEYILFPEMKLPEKGKSDQICTVEYSRTYDKNDICNEYTVKLYQYVVEK